MQNSFGTLSSLEVNNKSYPFHDLSKLSTDHLPYCLKVLLENLLRTQDGESVHQKDIEYILNWDPKAKPSHEISFTPSRVILQDFTGVPAIVDLAAMRNAMQALGGDPQKINPLSPVELVIDHSVMVDHYHEKESLSLNTKREFERNNERYQFLHWGQQAFENFKVVPPGTGIVHQVNLEYLARVVFDNHNGQPFAFPDTVVGTDSHTTMINGLGVLGWGVGGIEAEAAMLGQPISMLVPQVIGFELKGQLPEGATATDLVLVVVEILRKKGVVGKFVEFFGDGLKNLPLADRATIANMAPEYGATCGIFPIDDETLDFLRLSGRTAEQVDLVEAYAKNQGMFRNDRIKASYSDVVSLEMDSILPSIAGPKRPQDRINLKDAKQSFEKSLSLNLVQTTSDTDALSEGAHVIESGADIQFRNEVGTINHGSVVIAAITSCTNTSNPAVMLAAGLVAKAAHAKGLKSKPWVKTSLAPGSKVVTDYLNKANLLGDLEALGFTLVGYGCTTCIGNSGPLDPEISQAINEHQLGAAAVLSGNRNFEGRIHPQVKYSYLASPPLVVAYALAGTMNIDLINESLGNDKEGNPVFLKDIWPSQDLINDAISKSVTPEMFQNRYSDVFKGDESWQAFSSNGGNLYDWESKSTYVQHPPYFENMSKEPQALEPIIKARVLVKVGDSVTTDHISPAGAIAAATPAGHYLQEHLVELKDFNSYGSRRGNHEVMMRGTFANIRLKNEMAPGTEGGVTTHIPTKAQMSIFDAAKMYRDEKTPLIVIAGKEYGTGSSRDWAAKGTNLLGVKAVIAQSFERIHRSNLIGMGVLPLQFKEGQGAAELKLSGQEQFSIELNALKPQGQLTVKVEGGNVDSFEVDLRIDTPKELQYFEHGGILHYVLRQLAND